MVSFSVRTGSFNAVSWRVVSIVGEEALSELFSFQITVLAPRSALQGAPEAAELALAGQQVGFRIGDDGVERYGIIASARADGIEDQGHGAEAYARFTLEVRPRAWLLTQRRGSCIYQHMYVHEIVSAVLYNVGVNHRWALTRIYRKRVFCTQYDETDFEFVRRLLAEEGIFFYFEHDLGFVGAKPPTEPKAAASNWAKASSYIGAGGAVGNTLGGFGDSKFTDSANLAGDGLDMISKLIAPPPPDEEADNPTSVPPGSVGPGGTGDVFVFADTAPGYSTSTASDQSQAILQLTFRDDAELEGDHAYIHDLRPEARVRTGAATVRDYDFRRPLLLLETASPPGFEPQPQGAVLPASVGVPPLEVYAHHGEYETPEVDQQLADTVLAQYSADAFMLRGRGVSPRLLAGFVFQLENHTPAQVTEGRYAVTRLRHEWHAPPASPTELRKRGPEGDVDVGRILDGCARAIHEAGLRQEPLGEEAIRQIIQEGLVAPKRRTYQNRFDCVPAAFAFRPPRPPRVVRNVTESATVVGPIGMGSAGGEVDPTQPLAQGSAKEIYLDKYGRVKIQFHWDRDGLLNENSSCWVRVAQTWSGPGFGFQFFPRVGMEVLVTFLAGDPDRPVVIGSLYNATHATPEPLPYRGTRSGVRTQSSPGGGGFNELSFEDMKGRERVFIHAEKDLEEVINDSHTLEVKNNQKILVTSLQEIAVGGNQLVSVGQNQSTIVGGDQRAQVRGNRTSVVARNETTVVNGNALASVDGVAVRSVKADEVTVVEGSRELTVRGTSLTHVGGGDPDQPSSSVTFVQGSSFLTATQKVLIKAEKAGGDGSSSSIRLECGDSFLEIHADKITLSSKTIELLGGDTTQIKGKDASIKMDQDGAAVSGQPVNIQNGKGSSLQIDGQSATMTAGGSATVQGSKVALQGGGGGAGAADSPPPSSQNTPNLKLFFTHIKAQGSQNGIGDTPYRVVVEDQVYEGETDGSGGINIWVPDGAKVVHVVLWANKTFPAIYPLGPLVWLIHVVDSMSDATAAKGARLRLRNLAYDPGALITSDDLDDVTAGAIVEFQLDQEIPPTGLLDAATQTALTTAYGTT